jgi:hypothetical protein
MNNNELLKVVTPLLKREFIVNETMLLLNSNGLKLWSWGISKRMNFQDKGLLLKVSGNHHKGLVLITLDFNDTYTVDIISNKGVILETFNMIYFDQLFDVIDKRIEYIKDYVD